MARKAKGGVVWSSDGGGARPRPGPKSRRPAGDDIVRVSRQTKGRKGAGVTVITGVPLAGAPLKALAKELKMRCSSGGTVKGAAIEIQGDHRDRIVEILGDRGWTVKRVGG